MRFYVLTALNMTTAAFWDMAPCPGRQTDRPTNVYIINKINCGSDYSTRDQN